MEITVQQIINFLAVAAGALGSITAIFAFFNKINNKRVENERAAIMEPLTEQLQSISKKQDELKKEMTLIIKLNLNAVAELQQQGHINGGTTEALTELNEYLASK